MYKYNCFIMMFNVFFVIVMLLVSLAFSTILERSVLGFVQFRFGPNKTSFLGLMQPFSDALSLFIKSKFSVQSALLLVWMLSPIMGVVFLFLFFSVLPVGEYFFGLMYSSLSFLVVFSMTIYMVLGSFYSGSKYSVLGMCRSLVQMMSYEIVFAFVFLLIFYFSSSYSIYWSSVGGFGMVYFFVAPLFLVLLLMESGRMPFDLMEGESELVSGFNTEYWGGSFSFIFIYEYGMLVFISLFFMVVFFVKLFHVLVFVFVILLFIYFRASFPRLRYDSFLMFSWSSLFFLCFLLGLTLIV